MTPLSTVAQSIDKTEDKVDRLIREADHDSPADRAARVSPQEHRDGRVHDGDALDRAPRDPNDQDAVADEAARDDRTVQGTDQVMTDASGDGVSDAVDSDADGVGVADNAQSDRIRSLQEAVDQQPQTATTAPVVDLSNPPPPPPPVVVGEGPAWSPTEADGWGSRVKRMVDPAYRRSLSHDPTPSFQRGPAPRRGGRGGQDMRSARRRRG